MSASASGRPALIDMICQNQYTYFLNSGRASGARLLGTVDTVGQQAMAVAMMYPESVGRGKMSELNRSLDKTQIRYVEMSRTVLKYLPETAALVMAGTVPEMVVTTW